MHQDLKVARRYAKSLLDFAVEQGALEEVRNDMLLISDTCKKNKLLVNMLKSPIIKTDLKGSVFRAIFSGKIQKLTGEFLTLVGRRKRESIAPDIAHCFEDLYREYKGIQLAVVTTAVPLSDTERKKILGLASKVHHKVELKEQINTEIIGGFVLRVGDKEFDESVSMRLERLKTEFSKNPFIAKF